MTPITVELYTRTEPSWFLVRRLEKAGLTVRSKGVEHLFLEVPAESAADAVARVAEVLAPAERVRYQPRPLTSYLDAPSRPVAA